MRLPWIEIFGVIAGAACVLLAVRENVWNWPIGILNNIFFFILFWHSKLYADACLQVFYMSLAVYGLWNWLYGGDKRTQAPIARATRTSLLLLLPATAAAAGILYYVLSHYTDSNVPLGDAVTTALSLAAQYMLARKQLENWVAWISADVIYIGLYWYKSLYPTALLYVAFIAMCIAGYRAWHRTLEHASSSAGAAASEAR
jgi:nicotinamide mononucleotide transporter